MDTNNNVEKFDPSTLMQGVKDRIKATFVSLIPDGQWENMVQKEIDAFFELSKVKVSKSTTITTGSYGSSTERREINSEETLSSPFRELVWEHCAVLTKEILKEKIDKEYFTNHWTNNQLEVTDKMKDVIAEAAPIAAAKFFENISFGMMNAFKSQINQY